MAKFPEPGDLSAVPPIWHDLRAGTLVWRLYRRGGRHPSRWDEFRRFGPVRTARFDHHHLPQGLQDRGIIYLATLGPTTFAEAFQETRVIDPRQDDPWLVGFQTAARLHLLDLTGAWPTQAGASMAMCTGRRDRAQRWSQRMYETYTDAQGLLYPSSMDANRPCVALYERGQVSIPTQPRFHAALGDPRLAVLVQRAAARFHYRLVV